MDERHPVDRLELQQVQRNDGARWRTGTSACVALGEAPPYVLAPCTRRRTEVHHQLAGAQQLELLVELLELVGGPGTVPLLLGQLYVRVGDVVVEPGAIDLAALGLCAHGGFIIG